MITFIWKEEGEYVSRKVSQSVWAAVTKYRKLDNLEPAEINFSSFQGLGSPGSWRW